VSDVLSYPFMQRALVAAVLVGVVCSVIGTYVVLKKMAFIGAGISHSAFGGVALGYLVGLSPIGIAIPFCLATAMAIGWVSRKGRVSEDTAIGIAFASTMALGALFIGLKEGYNVDLFGYLFGSILAVSESPLAHPGAGGGGHCGRPAPFQGTVIHELR
jgi:ABC-type Mn2+/Zn2+ transport system permease subunit